MCVGRMSSSVDSYSCVVVDQKTIHIALPLVFVENTISGIRTVLDSWKNQYVRSLDGVLLSYRKVTFKNKLGRILTDQPCLHYSVQAEFSVFRPSVGMILRGTINRISREHVGCVVHDCINVSIYHVTNLGTDMADVITIGKTVLFKVTKVEILRKTLRIHGEISRACYRLMMGEVVNSVVKEEIIELNEETTDCNVDSAVIYGQEAEPSEEEIPPVSVVNEMGKASADEDGQVGSHVKVNKKKKRKQSIADVEPSVGEVSVVNDFIKVEKETSTEEEGQTNSYGEISKSKKKKPKRKKRGEERKSSEVHSLNAVEKVTSEEVGRVDPNIKVTKSKKKKLRKENITDVEPLEEAHSLTDVIKVEKETSGEEEGQMNSYVKASKSKKKKELKRKGHSEEMEPSEEVHSMNVVEKVTCEVEEQTNSCDGVSKSKKKKKLKRKEHSERMEPSEEEVHSMNIIIKEEKETSGEEDSIVKKSKKNKELKKKEHRSEEMEPSKEPHSVNVGKATVGEQTNLCDIGQSKKKKRRKEHSEKMEQTQDQVHSMNVIIKEEKVTSGEEDAINSKSKKKKGLKRKKCSEEMEPSEEEIQPKNVVTKVEKETSGEEEGFTNSYVKVSKSKKRKV